MVSLFDLLIEYLGDLLMGSMVELSDGVCGGLNDGFYVDHTNKVYVVLNNGVSV